MLKGPYIINLKSLISPASTSRGRFDLRRLQSYYLHEIMISIPEVEELRQRIIYEDDDLLVIDKPAGWPVHGDRHHKEGKTLLALVLRYLPELDFKPAFAHRLDKEASGLILLAKTQEALRSLNRQIKFKRMRKSYLALLVGEIRPQGSIRLALQKKMDRERWLAIMVPVKRGGLYAQTDWKRLKLLEHAGQRFSLVEARARTGRTHQLRAHFSAMGCPIVGDDIYGQVELNQKLRKELGLSRMLLHAAALEFRHPRTEELICLEAPLPKDFTTILKQLAHDILIRKAKRASSY